MMEKLTFGECTVVIHEDACRTQEETENILDRASMILYDKMTREHRGRMQNERGKRTKAGA